MVIAGILSLSLLSSHQEVVKAVVFFFLPTQGTVYETFSSLSTGFS